MVYAIFTTKSFEDSILKFSQSDRKKIQKLFLQLKQNPYVGDALRYKFFREKRIKEKRIYYLIYDDLSIILVIAISGKKAQQETINHIINCLPEYKKFIQKLSNS